MRDPYRPFQALIGPARPTAMLSRLVLGVILLVVLVFSLVFAISALLDIFLSDKAWESLGPALDTGDTPLGVLVNLYVFSVIVVALAIAGRAVHNRDLPSFIGNLRMARYHFGRVCLYLAGLHLVISVLVPTNPALLPTPHMAFTVWVAFLPLAIPALIIQTGAEELVFRGYLQSQLAARFKDPKIWILVPSIAFGLLHYDPLMHGGNTWLVVGWATAFGIAAADLTARTGTVGAAVALHFVNNFFAIFIAAPSGNFDGLALYSFPFTLDDVDVVWLWAPVDLMLLFVSWLTARLALRV